MSNIDRQRIAAVRKLEAMGYVFHDHDWTGPAIPATFEADVMHVTETMLARVEHRFDLKPERLAGDTAYGAAKLLKWLWDRGITSAQPRSMGSALTLRQ